MVRAAPSRSPSPQGAADPHPWNAFPSLLPTNILELPVFSYDQYQRLGRDLVGTPVASTSGLPGATRVEPKLRILPLL